MKALCLKLWLFVDYFGKASNSEGISVFGSKRGDYKPRFFYVPIL